MALATVNKQRAESSAAPRSSPQSEWYLAVCLVGLLTEAIFMAQIAPIVAQGPRTLFGLPVLRGFFSEWYFYTIGLVVGYLVLARSRRTWRVPLSGNGLVLALVLVYGGGAYYGWLRGNEWWMTDLRAALECMVILPWTAVLVQKVRFDVVFNRFMWAAVPLAIINGVMGLSFVARLFEARAGDNLWVGGWVGNYLLVLVFLLAFSRSIIQGRQAVLPMGIVLAGICAGLDKPSLATVFIGMSLITCLAWWLRRTSRSVRLHGVMVSLVILIVTCVSIAVVVSTIDKDSAVLHLRERFLKEGTNQDLSSGRLDMWQECLEIWSTQPLLGTGLGLKLKTPGDEAKPMAIHNYAIQTLMQTGVVGFTIVLAVVIIWLRRAFKTLRVERDPQMVWVRLGLISFICTMFVAMLYGDVIFAPTLAFAIWFAIVFETYAHSRWLQRACTPATLGTGQRFHELASASSEAHQSRHQHRRRSRSGQPRRITGRAG